MSNNIFTKPLAIYISTVSSIGMLLLLSSIISSFAFSEDQEYNLYQKYKKNEQNTNTESIQCDNNNINLNIKKISNYVPNKEIPLIKKSIDNKKSDNRVGLNTPVNICFNININKESDNLDKDSKPENLFVKKMSRIEKADDIYYNYNDEYVNDYEKDYFEKNQLKINEINNKVMENNKKIKKQDFEEVLSSDLAGLESTKLNIAFILPTFTMAAYDNSFYNFFRLYPDIQKDEFVSTDIDLLSNTVPTGINALNNYKSNGLHILKGHLSEVLPLSNFEFLDDKMVHDGVIFGSQLQQNKYDIIILAHSEYVTQDEYTNLKRFVQNGGILFLLDSNTFYAEVKYDNFNNEITFIKGHYWGSDGEKAWRDVKERWSDETTEWVGSNFGCSSCVINFQNNPFSYVHHEENYVTNPNVKILIDYKAKSEFDYLISAYELLFGKGKVISLGLFGDDVVHNQNFLKFFDSLIISNI
ncbi:MAG: hypothetical protein MRJ93_14805 [Nitrososphaeraceae archaeon]|nr:hypothetical protein [Nitrososphaeraceae archaeon]